MDSKTNFETPITPHKSTDPQLKTALQHHKNGDLTTAELLYQTILTTDPQNSTALHFLGVIAHQRGEYSQAIQLIQQAIHYSPNEANFHNSLGNTFQQHSQTEAAIASYQQALKLAPRFPEPYYNLGNLFKAQKNTTAALRCYQQAVAFNPQFSEAYNNLGQLLFDLNQTTAALACLQKSLAINPQQINLLQLISEIYTKNQQFTQAAHTLEQALTLDPQHAHTHNNLAINLLYLQGNLEQALAHFKQAILLQPSYQAAHSNWLFALQYSTHWSREAIFLEHRQFQTHHPQPLLTLPPLDTDPQRPLKIGYISPDFHQHSVAYFLSPILTHHNHQHFIIHAYSLGMYNDEVTQHLQKQVDVWRDCKEYTHLDLSTQIIEDRIDILIDLTGHTANNKILTFAQKPAPLQISYLGYPDTTGLSTIDCRLVDHYTDPVGSAETFSSETLLRMPHSYFCYDPIKETPPISPLPALTNGYLTFGSFNNFPKLNDNLLKVWAQLLSTLPTAQLFLKTKPLADPQIKQTLENKFKLLGIDPQRLRLEGIQTSSQAHLQLYQHLDIALDTHPYNGATTTCEALWMGIPVITWVGERSVSRMGLSILSTLGLEHLINYTPKDYIQCAQTLAQNWDQLSELRATLRSKMQHSPIMQGAQFTQQLETLYRQQWQNKSQPNLSETQLKGN